MQSMLLYNVPKQGQCSAIYLLLFVLCPFPCLFHQSLETRLASTVTWWAVQWLILHQKDPLTSIPFPWPPDYAPAMLSYHFWRVNCEIFTGLELSEEQLGQSYLGVGALERKNWRKWKKFCLKWLLHCVLHNCHLIQIRKHTLFLITKKQVGKRL